MQLAVLFAVVVTLGTPTANAAPLFWSGKWWPWWNYPSYPQSTTSATPWYPQSTPVQPQSSAPPIHPTTSIPTSDSGVSTPPASTSSVPPESATSPPPATSSAPPVTSSDVPTSAPPVSSDTVVPSSSVIPNATTSAPVPEQSGNSTTGINIPATPGNIQGSGEYLYVWSGADGRQVSDRLVTLDFNAGSRTYGQVVSQTLLPDDNAKGNEPHHCGLSADQKTLVCGGLLSLAVGQKSIFRFDLTNPAMPALVGITDGILGNIPDEFLARPDGTFFLTEMGSNTGGSPGRVAHVDAKGNVIAEWPENPPDAFNPHGIDIREDLNLMTTCDFVDPASTLNSGGDLLLRSSVRVWDYNAKTITKTINLPEGTGSMDCKLLKKDSMGRGFVGGSGNGKIFLWDSFAGTATEVIDMTKDILPINLFNLYTILAQYMQVNEDDSRLYIPYISDFDKENRSARYSGVAIYDITNPAYPRLLQNSAMPSYAAPHLCHILPGNRLVVTDYFLDEDDFGKIHYNGDHYVRVYNMDSNGLVRQSGMGVNFNNLISGVKLRPHGMATLKG